MKAITDIKELRGIQLDLLEEIHRFCQEHHIVYYLSSGTLLGAVRHGGYIPWDDDIDLYMPRESYERFVKEYTDTEGKFTLMEPRRSNHYFYTFAKLTDSRTMMVEDSYTSYPIGVYVDIFPLDYVTECLWKRRWIFWLKRKLFCIYADKCLPLLVDYSPWHVFKRGVCQLMPVRASVLRKWLMDLAFHKQPTRWVCNMTEVGPSVKGCFPAECVTEDVDIIFEGKCFKTMKGFTEYLSRTYGDYMKLPPENQRQIHHFEAYWR